MRVVQSEVPVLRVGGVVLVPASLKNERTPLLLDAILNPGYWFRLSAFFRPDLDHALCRAAGSTEHVSHREFRHGLASDRGRGWTTKSLGF